MLYSCLVQALGRLEHSRAVCKFNELDEEYNGSGTSMKQHTAETSVKAAVQVTYRQSAQRYLSAIKHIAYSVEPTGLPPPALGLAGTFQ